VILFPEELTNTAFMVPLYAEEILPPDEPEPYVQFAVPVS
jgi:hypothetical protein